MNEETYQELQDFLERCKNPTFEDRLLQQYEKEYQRKPTWSWIVFQRMIDRASEYDEDVIDYIKQLVKKHEPWVKSNET